MLGLLPPPPSPRRATGLEGRGSTQCLRSTWDHRVRRIQDRVTLKGDEAADRAVDEGAGDAQDCVDADNRSVSLQSAWVEES